MTIRAALVGCGAWGSNLLRVLATRSDVEIVAVVDTKPARLRAARSIAPDAPLATSIDAAIAARADAILIATPSPTHAALALRALDAGCDVFVEKPLAMDVESARRCRDRADRLGRVAMVGHILRFHPAIAAMIDRATSGDLGALLRFESARLSERGDAGASALWTLGPHDVSLLLAIDPSPIASAEAKVDRFGLLEIDLVLASGLSARLSLSQRHPSKERVVRVVGAHDVASVDDVAAPRVIASTRAPIEVAWEEPLALELDHFFACVASRSEPRTSFDEGATVVERLARIEAVVREPVQGSERNRSPVAQR